MAEDSGGGVCDTNLLPASGVRRVRAAVATVVVVVFNNFLPLLHDTFNSFAFKPLLSFLFSYFSIRGIECLWRRVWRRCGILPKAWSNK